MKATLLFDGASRGNPGQAGYGYVLNINGNEIKGADTIGQATNNEAEYYALKAGVSDAVNRGVKELEIRGDSELIVKQIRGEYDVNAGNLEEVYNDVLELLGTLDDWSITHIDREKNSSADTLATRALDSEERQPDL